MTHQETSESMPCSERWWSKKDWRQWIREETPKTHTLKEIGEFIGVPLVAVHRVEKEALKKLKEIMLELKINHGNTGI